VAAGVALALSTQSLPLTGPSCNAAAVLLRGQLLLLLQLLLVLLHAWFGTRR
jgi:hypothetical protein